MTQIFERAVFALFLILVASLAVQKPAVTDLFGKTVSVTDLIFPIVFLFTLAGVILRIRKSSWNNIYFFFTAYIGAFFFASLFSPDPRTSFVKTFATAYLIGLAVLAIHLIDSEKRLKVTIVAWLAGAAIPVLIGIGTIFLFYLSPTNSLLPYLTYHYGAVPVGDFPRLSSTFVSASMFCNYLTATALLLLAAGQFEQFFPILWRLFFGLAIVCSLFTVSAGLGAFVLGIALWLCYRRNCDRIGKTVKYAAMAICALSLLVTLIAFQPHSTAPYSFQLPFVGFEIYPSSRLLVWSEAIKIFIDNFLVGNGPGMPSASVIFQNTDGNFSMLTDAHNSFLSVATQTGIMGLIAFVWLCAYCLKVGFAQTHVLNIRFILAVAFLSAFVIQGLTGAFEDARHLWVLIGMLIASANIKTQI